MLKTKLQTLSEQPRYVPSLRVIELEKENRLLRKQLEEKNEEVAELKQEVQDLKLRVGELSTLLFRRKKSRKGENDELPGTGTDAMGGHSASKPRTRDSYRRQPPSDDDVTKTEEYALTSCQKCGSANLEDVGTRTLFLEDIPLIIKEVIKRIVHLYVCLDCRAEQTAHPLPRGQTVLLGPRVKQFVLYATYVLNASFRDVIRTLKDCFHIEVSGGELKHIQRESAQKLTPSYNGIHQELIEQEAVNADETGWNIGGVKNFLWGLCSPTTPSILFHIGTRGKGNIAQLLKDFRGCLTSDCYAAYKNLLNLMHQVCWVHLLRGAHDLSAMPWLSEEQKVSVREFHASLLALYRDLKAALAAPFDVVKREQAAQELLERLRSVNQLLPCDTPKKLKNIKLLTQEYEREMFACLKFKTALPENNLAERNMRHVVLKRKRSFGSQTEKGARIFAINASVILTLWRKFPTTFFPALGRALAH